MKNLRRVPRAIVSKERLAFCEKMQSDNADVVFPSKATATLLTVIERLAGAYMDCLADRDEWKEFGEQVQRSTHKT